MLLSAFTLLPQDVDFVDSHVHCFVHHTPSNTLPPSSLQQALSSHDSDLWLDAYLSEMASLMDNDTWEYIASSCQPH
jgi:hypothetical protein